jgi:type IV secretory pathway VirD2 relaxase
MKLESRKMTAGDDFEPKLGKIRGSEPKVAKSFRSKVLHATRRAGGSNFRSKSASSASKFGRGAGAGHVLKTLPSKTARHRRVVVKARFVKLAGKGLQAASAHLKYIQRDGVTREGQKGELYGPETDQADGKVFMERSHGGRHQFRFIVAPEDGQQYEDLKPLTRKLMTQMETDLGTKLDWVAVDHFNTGHPHTHIAVRGRDDQGKDLVIARSYLSDGLRERAEALVTLDLGPRSDLEIVAARQSEVALERFTSIDRHLLRDADANGVVMVALKDPVAHAYRVGRLARLESFGLAENMGDGRWQLRSDMEETLRRMGERGDIIKTLHRDLKDKHLEQGLADSVIHSGEPGQHTPATPVMGRLIRRGLSDEHSDRHYVILEATDGRIHYMDIGQGDRIDAFGSGAIIRVTTKIAEVRAVDHTIVEVATGHGGYYDIDAHLKHDPTARQTFAETHMRRLEAIRRATGGVDRQADGRFKIGSDYLEKALDFERLEVRLSPVKLEVISALSLEAQTRRNGVTWLDGDLTSGKAREYANWGFGAEVNSALRQRQLWLMQEGLASENPDGQIVVGSKLIEALHRREIAAVSVEITKASGLSYTKARSGEVIEGRLRQSVTLGSGKFAVIERSKDFTLVPWRPVLENHVGKTVSGILREYGINWTIGRGKGIGIE